MSKYADYIRAKLTYRDLLEQVAEESSELSQSVLKVIRACSLNSYNVTPVKPENALLNMVEEYNDLLCVLWIVTKDERLSFMDNYSKLTRWAERLGYKDGKE